MCRHKVQVNWYDGCAPVEVPMLIWMNSCGIKDLALATFVGEGYPKPLYTTVSECKLDLDLSW